MSVSLKDLMAAGAHFGHQVSQRHPSFKPFVHSERKGIHIINAAFTAVQIESATELLRDIVANGGKVLYVGTKPQISALVAEQASKTEQFSVTFRWLGGFLTNFKTVRNSIKKMIEFEEQEVNPKLTLTKKEKLKARVEYEKLLRVLNGVREMRRAPEAVIIVDVGHESIAVHECNKLGIPVIGLVDSNSDPTTISMPIPCNDDSVRAVELVLNELSSAILDGVSMQKERAARVEDTVEETEFELDKDEDLDEAALLARRKVYKVKKTITMRNKKDEEAGAEAAEGAADAAAETAPAAEASDETPTEGNE